MIFSNNPLHPVADYRYLTSESSGGVCIIPKVHGKKDGFMKVFSFGNALENTLTGPDYIIASSNLQRLPLQERDGCYLLTLVAKRLIVPNFRNR